MKDTLVSDSSPNHKQSKDPKDEVYLDNFHSHKRYLSEIMASSLNGLTVGDSSLPENLIESPARSKSMLSKQGMKESEAYQYFVLRAQKIVLSHGYKVVNWEETSNNFGSKLNPKTVVHNWLGGGVAENVVAAGLRCIVSNQDKWYLDYLETTWQQFYMNEPQIEENRRLHQELQDLKALKLSIYSFTHPSTAC